MRAVCMAVPDHVHVVFDVQARTRLHTMRLAMLWAVHGGEGNTCRTCNT